MPLFKCQFLLTVCKVQIQTINYELESVKIRGTKLKLVRSKNSLYYRPVNTVELTYENMA